MESFKLSLKWHLSGTYYGYELEPHDFCLKVSWEYIYKDNSRWHTKKYITRLKSESMRTSRVTFCGTAKTRYPVSHWFTQEHFLFILKVQNKWGNSIWISVCLRETSSWKWNHNVIVCTYFQCQPVLSCHCCGMDLDNVRWDRDHIFDKCSQCKEIK